VTLNLLVIQPTSLCNLNCRYCYVPGRRDAALISDEILSVLFGKLFGSGLVGPELEILWHAGEPLTAGLPFFERAVRIAEHHRPPGVSITHSIQTNGSLVNRNWASFFLQHRFSVGVSIDGPNWLHDQSRLDWAGRGTWDASIRGFDLLRSVGLEAGILCVLAAESLLHPDKLFAFFHDLGARWVGFNVEEVENANRISSLASAPQAEIAIRYRKFIERFFELWRLCGKPFAVREFDDILNVIKYSRDGETHFRSPDETLGLAILTVQKNGDLSTFSPEFAGGVCDELNNFVIGNVLDSDFDRLETNPVYNEIRRRVVTGIRRCATECKWFMFCGGAYTSNKYFENGDLESTQTTACRLHRQVLADTLLALLKRNAPNRSVQ